MNVKSACQFFQANPKLTKCLPEGETFKNAVVKFEKDGDVIKKVVTRMDGKEVTGHFKDGKLFKSTLESSKGKIAITDMSEETKNYPAFLQINKNINIKTIDGDSFTRGILKDGSYTDMWQSKGGPLKGGVNNSLYQKLMAKIKG